jgi:hypothetical protein
MTLLELCSTIAIVAGLASTLPQLGAMLRSRSAGGQSSLGWCLGAGVNGLMSYVNFVGYHAFALAAGNVASVVICVTAVALVLRFRHAHPAQTPDATVADLPTGELWALRDALEHEARRRTELAPA